MVSVAPAKLQDQTMIEMMLWTALCVTDSKHKGPAPCLPPSVVVWFWGGQAMIHPPMVS
jgi:hypothetical protein